MKLLDYILISVALLHSCNAARYTRQTENCPLIHAKDPSACVGAISECWSPGQLDVDCQNGAGVCCFNGCVNVCGVPKVCKTVHETRFENVTTEVCGLVEQNPVCTTITKQECRDECKVVDEVIPTTIEENVCNTVYEPICNPVSTQVCTPVLNAPVQQTCPVIHLKPTEECKNQGPSDCWSPGVLDLDCDNGAGLCCFNGCNNRCVKNCRIETKEVCTKYEDDDCKDVPSQVCNDVASPIQVPMKTTTCSKMDSACMSMPSAYCRDGVCSETQVHKCTEEGREECATVVTYVSKELVFNKCKVVYNKVCTKVPKESCRTESKEICPECKTVVSNKCTDVPRSVCNKVPKTVNKVVPKTVCNKVCEPRYEQSCTKPEPKIVCKPVTRVNSYQVPVSKCS